MKFTGGLNESQSNEKTRAAAHRCRVALGAKIHLHKLKVEIGTKKLEIKIKRKPRKTSSLETSSNES